MREKAPSARPSLHGRESDGGVALKRQAHARPPSPAKAEMAFKAQEYGPAERFDRSEVRLIDRHEIRARTRSAALTMAAQRWVVSKWLHPNGARRSRK